MPPAHVAVVPKKPAKRKPYPSPTEAAHSAGGLFDFVPGQALTLSENYLSQTRARDFWRRSDRGRWDYADGFDSRANPILPRHPREPGDRHTIRRSMAMVRRYQKPIIDRYNDHVFRQPVKRMSDDDNAEYGELLINADGMGTPLQTLMRRALRLAQTEGMAYLLADSNVEGLFQSSAQDQASGKRGILRVITPDQVVMWEEWEGQVTKAAIMFKDAEGCDFLWVVGPKDAYRVDIKLTLAVQSTGGQSSEKATMIRVESVGPTIPHNYGGCPLVRLCPTWEADGTVGDDSQAAPLAECQKRILNLDSLLWEELSGATFTMPVFIGVSPQELTDAGGSQMAVGPGMSLCLPNPLAKLDKIGADPAQATSLREQLRVEIAELYRVSGLSPGNPLEAAAPESGVAKAFAFNEVESKLAALSDACEHAENLAVIRLQTAFNWGDIDPAEYPHSFDTPDLSGELDYCIRVLSAPSLPAVLRRKAVENLASVSFTLSPEDNAELSEQLDAAEDREEGVKDSPFINGGEGGTPRRQAFTQ